MQVLTSFLATYMLLLVLLPCSDGPDWHIVHDKDVITVEYTSSSPLGHDHNENDCQDTCPPFCYCGCCGVFMEFPPSLEVSITFFPPVEISTETFLVMQMEGVNHTAMIWQPPRSC